MSKIIVRRQEYANNGTHANEIEAVVKQNLIANTLSSATDIAPSVGLLKSVSDKLNGESVGITLLDTAHFSIVQASVYAIGKLYVGSVTLRCIANFEDAEIFKFDTGAPPSYIFGLGAITSGQWVYSVQTVVRIYFKTNGAIGLTTPISNGQYLTIPVCLKVN